MSKKGSIFALLLSGRAMRSRWMSNKIATNEKKIAAEKSEHLDQELKQ